MKHSNEPRPFGRATLNRGTVALLAAMRVYVVLAVAVVVYAFVQHAR